VTGRRPRLLVLNQYYEPGIEATGRLLAQLCADLARDFDVTVVTGTLPNAGAARERRDGVRSEEHTSELQSPTTSRMPSSA